MAVVVETVQGTWHVRRRWAPRHLGRSTLWARFTDRMRRVRRTTTDLGDVGDPGCAGDVGEAIVVFIVVIAVVLFLILIGIPFLVALGELLLLLVLVVGGVIGKVVFRRPWTVDAAGPDGAHHEWRVVGWRPSGAARAFVAERLAATGQVPTPEQVAAATLAG